MKPKPSVTPWPDPDLRFVDTLLRTGTALMITFAAALVLIHASVFGASLMRDAATAPCSVAGKSGAC
jgi:hypothetical protein